MNDGKFINYYSLMLRIETLMNQVAATSLNFFIWNLIKTFFSFTLYCRCDEFSIGNAVFH